MKIRSFKHIRHIHKWIGFVCSVFFVVLSITGVLLMHYEELGMNGKRVSGGFLPDKYFEVATAGKSVQALLQVNDSTLLIGTHHGLFRSGDSGNSWEEIKEGLFSQDIRVLARTMDPQPILFAGTPQGIFRSEDGGTTWPDWIDAASGLDHVEVNDLAIHPTDSDRLFAATPGGLYGSDDGGESWQLVFAGDRYEESKVIHRVEFSKRQPDILYIGTGRGIFRSHNSGNEWQEVWSETIPDVRNLITLNTDPEFVYIASSKGLFKSFNEGRTWIKDNSGLLDQVDFVTADRKNISLVYAASGDNLYVSRNGGDQWDTLKIKSKERPDPGRSIRIQQILKLPGKPMVLVGTSSGLFISDDGGNKWRVPDLSDSANGLPVQEREMDLVKLITEIHTGRFFGSYFMLLVDIATVGLLVLIFTGIGIAMYRTSMRSRKKDAAEEELETDRIIDIQETADDLSLESMKIHEMIEHISQHLDKCKTIYLSRERKEIEEIDRHITTLDKKMNHLVQRLEEFEKISQG